MLSEPITPALIPHDQFHKGSWLLSVKRPAWYYFMRKESKHEIQNDYFLESVDTPLKELVSFLHRLGVKTTPSCAGHHKGGGDFVTIYAALEKDKEEIRSRGLRLRDIESGKIYIYRNENYILPWSREKFLEEVLQYQENGIIGILPDKDTKGRILQLRIPGVWIEEKDSIVFIRTTEDAGLDIAGKWKRITTEIKNIFRNKRPRVIETGKDLAQRN